MAFVPSAYQCPLLKSLKFLQNSKVKRTRNKSQLFQNYIEKNNSFSSSKVTPIHTRKNSEEGPLDNSKKKITPVSVRALSIRRPVCAISLKKRIESESTGVYFRTFALTSTRKKTEAKRPVNVSACQSGYKKICKIDLTMQTHLQSQDSLDGKLSPWKSLI